MPSTPRRARCPARRIAQSLALGGVNVNDYISTGNNRDAFDGRDPAARRLLVRLLGRRELRAVRRRRAAPTTATCSTIWRSSARRARSRATSSTSTSPGIPATPTTDPRCLEFDPAFFDRANLEALVAANPNLGREINLINNDLKTPYSDQFSLGMRNRFDLWNQSWVTSATISYVESKDGIVFLLGNRRGNGSFRENPAGSSGSRCRSATAFPGSAR